MTNVEWIFLDLGWTPFDETRAHRADFLKGTYNFEEGPCSIPLELMVSLSAHRIMLEAMGRPPKTKPPGERTDEEKHPEVVERGVRGGRPRERS